MADIAEFKNYLQSLGINKLPTKPLPSFRITDTENKIKVIDSLKKQGFEFKHISNLGAYILTASTQSKLSKTPEFLSGQIYIQELSSMLPAIELDIQNNDKVIDLCAAPGSKTIQMLSINKNINIAVVEKSRARFFKLKENLSKYSNENIKAFLIDARHILKIRAEFENSFDKVLADVPCSNEASIFSREDLSTWNPKNSKGIAKVQKGILNIAFKLLKPGGTLVYSTCTFSPEENEKVIDWLLKRNPNARLEKPSIALENLAGAITKCKEKSPNPQLKHAFRIIPNEEYKGFFVAKITKTK